MRASNRITRLVWDLTRFGLTPSKLAARLGRNPAPRVFCISLPKSGTHLLERALCLHPLLHRSLTPTINNSNIDHFGPLDALLRKLRPGQILLSHIDYLDTRKDAIIEGGAKAVVMIRDPRDIVVSLAFYIARNPNHPRHALFRPLSTPQEWIELAILGDDVAGLRSIRDRLARFHGWLHQGHPVVRYEDLIGVHGNGSSSAQQEALTQVFKSLDLPYGPHLWAKMREQVFSSASPTFRKGRIGQWRDHFNPRLQRVFLENAGSIMTDFGYEAWPTGSPQ